MKRKGLYILLAISITCALFSACNKNDSVEAVNVVEETTSIVESESVTEETETTTVEEIESTVEVVESTEEIETTTVEEVYSTEEPTTVDEYEGMSTSDQEAIEDMAQQLIADYLKDYAQDNQVEVDVPGGTPYDPSQDGQIVIGDNPALAGDYIN